MPLTGFAGATLVEAQSPLTFETTFGGLPGPWDVTSVVRVHVARPLLVESTVMLVLPGGALP